MNAATVVNLSEVLNQSLQDFKDSEHTAKKKSYPHEKPKIGKDEKQVPHQAIEDSPQWDQKLSSMDSETVARNKARLCDS